MEKSIELKDIEEIIKQKRICILCTCFNGQPRGSTVSYYTDGLDIYFGTLSTSIKFRNLKNNNKIALVINDLENKYTLQIEGIAIILSDNEFKAVIKKFPKLNDSRVDSIIKTKITKINFTNKTQTKGFDIKNNLRRFKNENSSKFKRKRS